jgi:CubicO group peptidase (beta-lactamase class C family)/predicted dienelactone hydrolase
MVRFTWTFSVLMVFVLLLCVCQPAMAQTETAPAMEAHTPRGDAPAFGIRGPYAVGVRDFVIEPAEEGGRSIPVTIWYPALNPDELAEDETYVLDFDEPNMPNFMVAGHALRDAEPDTSSGPYPLLVYSHGYWLFRQVSVYLTEHLASWGFVVIAGDHSDNWSTIFGESQVENYVTRPQEVSREIDFAETLTEAKGAFPDLIDLEHVGVIGHSFGADTTLLTGGARLNTDLFINEWCAMYPGDPDDPLNDCAAMPKKLDEMADMAGLNEIPEGLWPDWSDPRVDAIAPLAPGPNYFGQQGLATVSVPIIYLESELDWAQGLASEYYEPYATLPDDLKAHVLFERGDHGLFHNDCDAMPAWIDFGFDMWCWDQVWSTDRAHDLINHFVTAFMLTELKGDADATAALDPDSVDFRGIEFATTRFGSEREEATLDSELISQIEAFVEQEMEDNGIPGMSIGIVKDGEAAYAKGFGVVQYDTDRAMTPQIQFPVACITKGFTTAAIMQLVDLGLIDLNTQVIEYLPYFKLADEGYKEITIHDLLANTAGLPMPDYVSLYGGYSENPSWTPDLLEAYVRSLADRPMMANPADNVFMYGGDYFDILGAVIAEVSGQPFEEYMEEHILDPLGLEHTTFIVDELEPALTAAAHWRDENGEMQFSVPSPTYYPAHTPSNGMFSTSEDLLKWAIFNLSRGELDGEQIVPASAYDEMWKPQAEIPWGGNFQHWGYGWGISDIEGHRLAFWGGGHIGAPSAFYLVPEEGLAVHVTVNYSPAAEKGLEPADAIAFQILQMLFEENAEGTAATMLDTVLVDEIELLVENAMAENQIPGFAIAVVKDGEVSYVEEFGFTGSGTDQPVTSQSLFPVASLSKQFTAAAIMQLVEQGKIDLDSPVIDYLPYFEMADPRYTEITIRQLLAHVSGMPQIPQREYGYDNQDPGEGAREKHIRKLAEFELDEAPGETWSYSNLGFNILGEVIANVSGETYEQYVQEHIMTPLGMNASTFLLGEVDFDLLAKGHYLDEAGELATVADHPYTRAYAPSTGLVTNIEDLSRWALALSHGGELDGARILESSTLDEQWTPVAEPGWGGLLQDYGLGWLLAEADGHRLAWHLGTNPGYSANVIIAPEDGIGVVTIGNLLPLTEDQPWFATDVGNKVMLMLLGVEE